MCGVRQAKRRARGEGAAPHCVVKERLVPAGFHPIEEQQRYASEGFGPPDASRVAAVRAMTRGQAVVLAPRAGAATTTDATW